MRTNQENGAIKAACKRATREMRIEYASLTEALELAARRGYAAGDDAELIDGRLERAAAESAESCNASGYFNGHNLGSITHAVSNPPAELLRTVESMRARIAAQIPLPQRTRRRLATRRESGDELDALAWINRRPDGWTECVRDTVDSEVITIGVNLSTECSQRAESLLYRGAVAAALADILTAQGRSVEIVAIHSITAASTKIGRFESRLIVKASTAPLDIGAVAVALCEIAFYRLIVISADMRARPGRMPD